MQDPTCILFTIAATLAAIMAVVSFILSCCQFFLVISLSERLSRAETQVTNTLLPQMIPENMEPGVYMPHTNPVTKETTYVKEGSLNEFEQYLNNSPAASHDFLMQKLDGQIANAKRQPNA